MTTDIDKLLDGVEAVARFDEKRFGRRSPFHLTKCGGCGCPAFQQPCPLCGFYPRGSDKGYWHPKVATKELFCSMVDRSGPGGRDGTIATWHAVCKLQKYENRQELSEAAAIVDVPSAAEYWDAVCAEGLSLSRKPAERFLWAAWNAVGEIGALASGQMFQPQSRQAPAVKALIGDWADAVHSGDHEEISDALQRLRKMAGDLRFEYPGNGNLLSAVRHLDEAIEMAAERTIDHLTA